MTSGLRLPGATATTGLLMALLACVLLALAFTTTASARQARLPVGSIDNSDSPGGSFCCVTAVGVDQGSGDVFVADPYAPPTYAGGAVTRFDADGHYSGLVIDGSTTPQGSLSNPSSVAVDSSGGASDGNIYVADTGNNRVDAFDAAGALISSFGSGGQLDGSTTPAGSFSSPAGLAVDAAGDLYVADPGNNRIWIFDSTGAYLGDVEDPALNSPGAIGLDSGGDLYVRDQNSGVILKFVHEGPLSFGAATVFFSSTEAGEFSTGLAVDPSSDHVLVDIGPYILEYDSAGEQVISFGRGTLNYSQGVGVASGGRVYAADSNKVQIFGLLVALPDVTTGDATAPVGSDDATLNGTVNPAGPAVTECFFEYGLDAEYGSTVPCASNPDPGSLPVPVSADLSDLAPNLYHYRLVAGNSDGATQGADETFAIVGPPVVLSESAVPADDHATLTAKIHPSNAATTYHFEYGPTSSYGSRTADAIIPARNKPAFVTMRIAGLSPAAEYHFRVFASNAFDSTVGAGGSFTTLASVPVGDRHYEMVTPDDKGDGDPVSKATTMRISADGNRVVYTSSIPFKGTEGQSGANTYAAERTPVGWVSHGTYPPQDPNYGAGNGGGAYEGFSSDLSYGVLNVGPPAPVAGQLAIAYMTYRRDLFAPKPTYQVVTDTSQLDPTTPVIYTDFSAATADLNHIVFQTSYVAEGLTPDAPDGPEFGGNNIRAYIWTPGGLRYLGYLPDGTTAQESSTGVSTREYQSYKRIISTDGSSVVFTAKAPGAAPQLYLWREGASTLDISRSQRTVPDTPLYSPGAKLLQTASADHSKIFFTSRERLTDDTDYVEDGSEQSLGTLYEYQPATDTLTSLTTADPKGAEMVATLGSSEDGSTVYFIAKGKLSPEANRGDLNVYVWQEGKGVSYVTTLSSLDDLDWSTQPLDRGTRTSRVSPDGQALLFSSRLQQTDYDNAGQSEAYLYNLATDTITCASCRPDGGVPTSGALLAWEGNLGLQFVTDYLPHTLSANGKRVFFETTEALVPEDVNRNFDVYEYSDDRVRLVSTGTGDSAAHFSDATPDGSDVLFSTRQRINGHDTNDYLDLYVARAAGAPFPEPPPAPIPCSGDGCKGQASSAQPFPGPGSASFSGPAGGADCSVQARKGKRLHAQAKKLRAKAGKASGKRRARLHRDAKQLEKRAKRTELKAKSCTQAKKGAGK